MRRLPAAGGSGKPSGMRPASASSGDARRTISGRPVAADVARRVEALARAAR